MTRRSLGRVQIEQGLLPLVQLASTLELQVELWELLDGQGEGEHRLIYGHRLGLAAGQITNCLVE